MTGFATLFLRQSSCIARPRWVASSLYLALSSSISGLSLRITVRLLLFPLSIQQIKSAAAMRKLKPEMDELNARYKDDATQRGLAMQELWR
ncbi:MAG TPA: YidC/Oxa1 family membrane protein insertase, partial [Sorangium sp.]|nr:YidC/Oxa1 family membrane protein insertase [Sorangium sp.]